MPESETDMPDMGEEMAENIEDISAEIEAETRPDFDGDSFDEEPPEEPTGPEGIDIGDMGGDEISIGRVAGNFYALSANIATKNYGSGEAIFENEDGSLDTTVVEQLEIPDYIDQIVAKHEMGELTPEQALVISSAIFAVIVVQQDPELLEGLTNREGEN